MKLSKTITASLLALSIVSMSDAATTVVRITGSTAFRGNAYNAILHIFDAAPTYAYDGSGGYTGATHAVVSGKIGGADVIIKTSWTGSEGGIQTTSRQDTVNTPVNYLPDSPTGGLTAGGNNTSDSASDASAAPDITFSDTYQASSVFKGTYQGKTYSNLSYPSLTNSAIDLGDGIVGIVAFKFLASKGSTLTDLTTQNARQLFKSGFMNQALLTGTTDHTITVYATGRDFDSGTRLTTLAETGIGAKSSVKQYMPSKVASSTSASDRSTAVGDTIADIVPWPAGSVNGISYVQFNGGYNSGAELTKALSNTAPAGKVIVGYAGQGDADKAGQGISTGAVELSYNGVKLGVPINATLISEGKYTFWGYEHIYYNSSASATAVTVATDLANQLASGGVNASYPTADAPAPLLSAMQVGRPGDGGIVSQNY